jgi:UDP-3-O-[3-hydroxymyristoyl] glucosamine N-acyltransferase
LHTGLVRVQDLAEFLQASFEGDGDVEVRRAAALEEASPRDVSFVMRGRAMKSAGVSKAGCLIVPQEFDNAGQRTIIRAKNPRAAMARAIARLHPRLTPIPGVDPSAAISLGATIGPEVYIGPFVSIGVGARIGAGTTIGAGSVIGDSVVIGERCTIHPRVTIYDDVILGHRVVVHAGAVIGADGFGYVFENGVYENFPQIGRVEIGDRVEIGANACVDRAALGVTSIGEGTKIDNMVHIGHNCQIGCHVVIAAQTGFSGGVVVEDYAVVGGQVGVGDKARIESRAVVGSGSGILTSKIVRAGQPVWGTPARPLKEYLSQLAVLSRLAKKRKTSEEA